MTPEKLAKKLLTPADLRNLGISGLVVAKQQKGTASAGTGSGTSFAITFVSGDPGCKSLLNLHTPTSQAWAYVMMGNNGGDAQKSTIAVTESIDSFAQPAEAEQLMRENRAQLASCHSFVGVNDIDKVRYTFTHKAISVPAMGQDTVAHQLYGVAGQRYLTWNVVEVRSGTDVVEISYAPGQRGTADTAKVAAAAMSKYSAAPK